MVRCFNNRIKTIEQQLQPEPSKKSYKPTYSDMLLETYQNNQFQSNTATKRKFGPVEYSNTLAAPMVRCFNNRINTIEQQLQPEPSEKPYKPTFPDMLLETYQNNQFQSDTAAKRKFGPVEYRTLGLDSPSVYREVAFREFPIHDSTGCSLREFVDKFIFVPPLEFPVNKALNG
ncbi:hypothetical protein HPB50_013127 [Hyalomma asiaticum]|uniref:Uncharacterized protein n=1 Tax=Hyalomma asiaticum TaxID=266040 RepID=A0ACB7S2G6_HYAAI|nr:hypothetical protein HPB50_013127 [Hyalomma asiaticum]